LYAFGLETNKPHLIEVADELLQQLPPENNQITRILQLLNIKNCSAKVSQSLIAQHKLYCSIKGCRDCEIGRHLLNLPFMVPEA
jgi:mRNA-degrading endonuclease YafQ of YafQ-DinJ toxin-antitoxin module